MSRPRRSRAAKPVEPTPTNDTKDDNGEDVQSFVASRLMDEDLRDLEALASDPNPVNLSSLANNAQHATSLEKSTSFEGPRQEEPKQIVKLDKKIVKETFSIAYSFILTMADKTTSGTIPGNRMNDIISTRPGYQARLDNLLYQVAEEYGVSDYVPPSIALLLFSAQIYAEASNSTPSTPPIKSTPAAKDLD